MAGTVEVSKEDMWEGDSWVVVLRYSGGNGYYGRIAIRREGSHEINALDVLELMSLEEGEDFRVEKNVVSEKWHYALLNVRKKTTTPINHEELKAIERFYDSEEIDEGLLDLIISRYLEANKQKENTLFIPFGELQKAVEFLLHSPNGIVVTACRSQQQVWMSFCMMKRIDGVKIIGTGPVGAGNEVLQTFSRTGVECEFLEREARGDCMVVVEILKHLGIPQQPATAFSNIWRMLSKYRAERYFQATPPVLRFAYGQEVKHITQDMILVTTPENGKVLLTEKHILNRVAANCPLCKKRIKRCLYQHTEVVHAVILKQVCLACPTTFKKKRSYIREHSHCKILGYTCDLCGLSVFKNVKEFMKKHVEGHVLFEKHGTRL